MIPATARLAAGILDPEWTDDATHVATATVTRADAIVSWNFRHIVRIDKLRRSASMNRRKTPKGFGCVGFKRKVQREVYKQIKGLSPEEEIEYFRREAAAGPGIQSTRHSVGTRGSKEKSSSLPRLRPACHRERKIEPLSIEVRSICP
jgi:hypothetical protein